MLQIKLPRSSISLGFDFAKSSEINNRSAFIYRAGMVPLVPPTTLLIDGTVNLVTSTALLLIPFAIIPSRF